MRGRRLKVPAGDRVRPTQDMVRQALFSSLAEIIPGCRFLDLFAGSGAVGLEAWSRGAREVNWVESSPVSFRILQDNVRDLCGEAVEPGAGRAWKTVRSDVFHYLAGLRPGVAYDIVFADPPYEQARRERWGIRLLEELSARQQVSPGGFLVVEQARGDGELVHPAWGVVLSRLYGGTSLTIYKLAEKEGI